jgi:hypothetical protein
LIGAKASRAVGRGLAEEWGFQMELLAYNARKKIGADPFARTFVVDPGKPIRVAERSSLPNWLKERFEAGQNFDRVNRTRYPYNEVEVVVDGGTFKVDSYAPGKEIVSRKLTQLGNVRTDTAFGYLRELSQKYASGASITHSPFNPAALRGGRLRGDLILEVPVQKTPIPKAVLDEASTRGITIRDVSGKIYNP